ncbi:hypothetical protein [Deinococcus hopiensis]|uniref:Protein N-acetyltransferase, RimJ/RimL family n=1 Tax=Deinococcus hopiensis KR-140 TaxID=695939 RepID=A0A1W1UAV2_9DEIO|nr:hypothetical protein [Deinococcus hopiensis]SMB78226.1 hypothetical protein SAMN00790413_06561 [Deinococcus hopiensis KR-140]
MTLNPTHLPVPTELVTPRFALRRQQLTDNAVDYDAVMDSQGDLRIWSDSTWPEDTFTLKENAQDLAMHIGEHDRDEAYGFSIFSADQGQFLGSLYVNQVAPFIDNYRTDSQTAERLKQVDARVEYWLRRGVDRAFEMEFLRAVQAWMVEAWWFQRVAFGSRRGMHEQRGRYEAAGMTELAQLIAKEGERRFHFHT